MGSKDKEKEKKAIAARERRKKIREDPFERAKAKIHEHLRLSFLKFV